MLDWYYHRIKNRLFQQDPEEAHEYVIGRLKKLNDHPHLCRLLEYWYTVSSPHVKTEVMGLPMRNPIGLAAGLDKNGIAARPLAALGFGSLELGAVLPQPQPGNHRPRVFRDVDTQTVENGMGFPSDGAIAVMYNCMEWHPLHIPVGCNLGKQRDTPLEKTAEDMVRVMDILYEYFDWFTVNVSSPNTPGLREVGVGPFLTRTLEHVIAHGDAVAKETNSSRRKPVVVKLSPDQTSAELIDSVERSVAAKVDGICLGNTWAVTMPNGKPGGKSGRSLYGRTYEMIREAAPRVNGKCALIACGGVNSADRAKQLLDTGADMVQILTTLFFDGPGQVKRILEDLNSLIAADNEGEDTWPHQRKSCKENVKNAMQ